MRRQLVLLPILFGLACLVYLLALGVFATRSLKGTAGGRP